MTKVDRSTYAGFSNKLSKGTPNQYFVQRFIDHVSIQIYPTPDSTNASKDMHFFFIKRIQDIGDYTNATDVPFRFVPCMVSGLAFYLAQKYRPEMVQAMKLYYEDEFARALAEDGSASSTHIEKVLRVELKKLEKNILQVKKELSIQDPVNPLLKWNLKFQKLLVKESYLKKFRLENLNLNNQNYLFLKVLEKN
jgi:hypothetical protein